MLQERQQHSVFLKNHLERARLRMRNMADRHRTDRSFQVGDQVLLKLQPYTQSSVVNRPCPKLAYKFYGSFEVQARVGTVAYRLNLPPTSLVHPVFHISQLKPFVPKYTAESTELPILVSLDVADLMPEEILESRLIKKGNKTYLQVRIKWSNLPASSSTWEDYDVLKTSFPAAPAWRLAASQEEGNVTSVSLIHDVPL